jgi:Holliday junction DNA helicase RuvA
MIGKITGKLLSKNHDNLVIDVSGIGYVVFATEKTLAAVSSIDREDEISLFTELLVKEDLLQLIGFISSNEKDWFNLLRSVQGVGAKVALAILNTIKPEDLLKSIRLKNEVPFKAVSGVGPRMAQRIIVELSGRRSILNMTELDLDLEGKLENNGVQNEFMLKQEIHRDALSALQNLGFKRGEAEEAIENISNEIPDSDASEIVKNALRFLANRNTK